MIKAGAFSYFRMTLTEGVGSRLGWGLLLGSWSFDEQMEAMESINSGLTPCMLVKL